MSAPNFLRKINDATELRAKYNTAISLFSGCGGMDLGMRQAGFEIRVMIDNSPECCQTLWVNFTRAGWKSTGTRRGRIPKWMQDREPVILQRDICELSTAEILHHADLKVGECGVVTGGFPCQGFSTSGKRVVDDPRNSLYKQCVRVVAEALPKAFIFENVPGLVSMAKGRIINRICAELAEVGYDVMWDVLNAADYGVPQERRRVFFIGHRVDVMVMPARGKRLRLHIGVPGRYKHPKFFERQYGIPSTWELAS